MATISGEHGHTHVDHAHAHDGDGQRGRRHTHDHPHPPAAAPGEENLRRLTIVLALTASFMVVEAVAGFWTNSLVLLSDAGHMLTDVGALSLALFALWFSRRDAPRGLTFGYLRFEILAALINGMALLIITALIFMEAWHRLHRVEAIKTDEMMVVAFLGLVVNLTSLKVLSHGGHHSLNERGAILHIIGDVLGSVAAIVAGALIKWKGWYQADPIISALIGLLILRSTWELLRETVNILMEGTPIHLTFEEVHEAILSVTGVTEVKDLHLWSLASGFDALSAHIVVPEVERSDEVRHQVRQVLHQRFGIGHTTLEVERPGDSPSCPPGLEGRCDAWPRTIVRRAHRHDH